MTGSVPEEKAPGQARIPTIGAERLCRSGKCGEAGIVATTPSKKGGSAFGGTDSAPGGGRTYDAMQQIARGKESAVEIALRMVV